MNNVRLFTLAVSLGGVESLIEHPASMTHASVPNHDREQAGILDELVRLSVGCEDFEDLRDDLDQALNAIPLDDEAVSVVIADDRAKSGIVAEPR